jgi:lysophospholipase L1-like esterase
MATLKKREIQLVPEAENAFGFKVIDTDTGRELSRSEVEELQRVLPPPQAARIKSMAAQSVKICGEGDSWLNLLSHFTGFPKTLFDVLGETFPTRNLAFPGDTLEEVLAALDYESVLESGLYRVFIFSAGGNDILGGGGLAGLLKHKSDGNGSADPAAYVDQAKLKQVLTKLEKSYRTVARQAKQFEPRILMLIHGYDHALPRKNGPWLGKVMALRGYAHNDPLSASIIAYLVNALNTMLKKVDADFPHVRHVDVRGTVNGRWHDELHPKEPAARDIAKLFEKEIKSLLIS